MSLPKIDLGPITPEELSWAVECAAEGDTLADISAASGRPAGEWDAALSKAGVRVRRPLADCALDGRERRIAELYEDGVTFAAIGRAVGLSGWWVNCLTERLIDAGVLVRRVRLAPSVSEVARERARRCVQERASAGLAQYFSDRNAAIVAAVSGGMNYRQAAAAFGTTRSAVGGVMLRDRRRRATRGASA